MDSVMVVRAQQRHVVQIRWPSVLCPVQYVVSFGLAPVWWTPSEWSVARPREGVVMANKFSLEFKAQ
ncbi:hypothetical protein, partial [Allokutzneria sp. NRRL B-24872]|uniref:hypothetical protein n=1 Tax=Allokutzneria sp. NRRL B-24872 TaxID=1137961 RepID=UPI001AEF876E